MTTIKRKSRSRSNGSFAMDPVVAASRVGRYRRGMDGPTATSHVVAAIGVTLSTCGASRRRVRA
jgi:hypothetical protein